MMRRLSIILLFCFISACVSAKKEFYPAKQENQKQVFIVSHGWHTGIVLKKADIPALLIPEKADFPNDRFLEIGWGDKGFYQAPKITVPLTLKAIFWPTPAVMHVVGFSDSPERTFTQSKITKITLSSKGYQKLVEKIHASFDRRTAYRTTKLREGLYGHSLFYPAIGRYHLFHTCNNWTAHSIRKSGFPITPLYSATAGNVMKQVANHGEILR